MDIYAKQSKFSSLH